MFSNFRKAFCPTEEEIITRNKKINEVMRKRIDLDGEGCHTCSYSTYPINNPYDNAFYCKVSDHITEAYEVFKCGQYKFVGWLPEK